ncbi:ABC transporter ATP-binding protein [Natrinema sp. SYSU A 869]|uniref:ABC transporter ATP-binding protein n=1 Tax=Natrinema sp. SYSU A 869 TaxID=2871694 RepID=UPI001CA41D05|nr:ABC transporter ATP-binding protein [Natrinema sp. SYSU A 869]
MAHDPPPSTDDRTLATTNKHTQAVATPPVTVHCSGVTHEYGDNPSRLRSVSSRTVTALEDVSFEIRAGEVVGLVGPSGSGKSTVLHVVGGLLEPSKGTVDVLDTDLTTLSSSQRTRLRRDHVGLVFQQFHLLSSLSARDNVALPLVERGVARRERQQRATELLEQVGLDDRMTHRPGELSGGEQQRVAIARALVTDPEIVLADEPTGELDTETGEQVLELLVDIADDQTVLVATHDERAIEVTDRVLRLLDGVVTVDERR